MRAMQLAQLESEHAWSRHVVLFTSSLTRNFDQLAAEFEKVLFELILLSK